MKMIHKDSRGEIDVPPSQVGNAESKGWTVKPEPKAKSKPEVKPQQPKEVK